MTNPHPHMCRNGHPRTPTNTLRLPDGETKCRACHYATQARYRARLKAARVVQPRLPFGPLLEWVAPCVDDAAGQPPGTRTVAARCRTTARIVHRWMRCGMKLEEADAAAVALGMHPCEVWPEWWEVAA